MHEMNPRFQNLLSCSHISKGLLAIVLGLIPTGYLCILFSYEPVRAVEATAVNEPVDVPLIKLEYPGNPPNIRMLYVRLQGLGDKKLDVPVLFDTGSPGITIECAEVLPMRYCSEKGIKLKKPLELEGITVTTERIVSRYMTYDEYGNLAFARVTFGSIKQSVSTTERVPILIRYKKVRRSTGEIVGGYLWPKGIFGVSPIAEGRLKSPIYSISFGQKVHRGFYLSPIGTDWRICTNERRDCPEADVLHVGIDASVKSKFQVMKWQQNSPQHNIPTVRMCLEWEGHSKCRPTLYDTGNSAIQVGARSPKKNETSLLGNTAVSLKGPAHTPWQFKTRYRPEVEFVPHIDIHVVGIRYFEENSLLFDFETKEVGFRIGTWASN